MEKLQCVRTQYEIVALIITTDDYRHGRYENTERRIMDGFANERIANELCKDLTTRSAERCKEYSYRYQCETTELRPVSGLLDDVWSDRDKIIGFTVRKPELTEADFWDGELDED